jgi:hypothetical protein
MRELCRTWRRGGRALGASSYRKWSGDVPVSVASLSSLNISSDGKGLPWLGSTATKAHENIWMTPRMKL